MKSADGRDAENILIYLEEDVAECMRGLAEQKGTEVESLVNDWLRRSIGLVRSAL